MKYATCLITLTALLFIAKLTLWTSLSWWWVFAPIYGPILSAIIIIAIMMIIAAQTNISNAEEIYND